MRAIYIAGPMRGRPKSNFPAFDAAALRFRLLGEPGQPAWSVYSPREIGEIVFGNDPDVPGAEYIRQDVRYLSQCAAIALLPGWEASTGARCEVAIALTLGLEFYDAETMDRVNPPLRVTINGGYERAAGRVDTLDDLARECTEWANSTFSSATSLSRAKHLLREARELVEHPSDPEEMADIFMLLGHLAAGEGVDLASAIRAKLEKNRLRKWGKPDADGVVEHVAEGAE